MSQSILAGNAEDLERLSIYRNKSLIDIAWAAGILEGEGCFSIRKNKKLCASVICTMTDEDTIESLYAIFGIGYVNKLKLVPSLKQTWRWYVTKQIDVYKVLVQITPFLRSRRASKATELLEEIVPRLIARGELDLRVLT